MRITPRRLTLAILPVVVVSLPVGLSVAAGQKSSSDESHPKIEAIDTAISQMKPDPNPDLTAEERHVQSAAKIDQIVEDAGGTVRRNVPDDVVVSIPPNPLDGIDMEADDRFCEKLKKLAPNDHTCELDRMVQAGTIPPGDYTQAQIDALFGGE